MCERTLIELLRKMERLVDHLLEEPHGFEYLGHVVELKNLIKELQKYCIERAKHVREDNS